MKKIKALHENMCTEGVNSINFLCTIYNEFFIRKDYDWWHTVQEDDIVMDIGAHMGMFTCHALDLGAKRVYSIEPNKTLLKTTMKNAFDHIVDKKECPVIPIHCMIGDKDSDKESASIYGVQDIENAEVRSFKEIVKDYQIDHIDFLKIDCEGGEYTIFTEENLEFIKTNVRHIAVEFHITINKEAPAKFKKVRDEFLCHFEDIKYMDSKTEFFMSDEHLDNLGDDPNIHGGWFMLYIRNQKNLK
jgi:FkbM family methyltransferase